MGFRRQLAQLCALAALAGFGAVAGYFGAKFWDEFWGPIAEPPDQEARQLRK
jgi:hypothetical protein